MRVQGVKLKDFRNYGDERVSFDSGMNLICGDNAAGKTNLLEAVYVCCIGKSQRAKDKELISFGKERARVFLSGENRFGETTVDLRFSRRENKTVLLDGIPVRRTAELLSNLNVIYFSPDELKLIKDAPQSRRRFLDTDISQIYKQYYDALTRYQKILLQRNNLLKSRSPAGVRKTVEVWDEQLARYAAVIIGFRESFLARLAPFAEKTHAALSAGREILKLGYQCTAERTQEGIFRQLSERLDRDFELGFTSVGPHRDDLKITLNDADVRLYGSQGQQRSAALSLKIAELRLFEELVGEPPILILDDVLSELDLDRQKNLLSLCRAQTLISAAHVDPELRRAFPCHVIRIEKGHATDESAADSGQRKDNAVPSSDDFLHHSSEQKPSEICTETTDEGN